MRQLFIGRVIVIFPPILWCRLLWVPITVVKLANWNCKLSWR